jgi:hypothetical protein
MALFDRLRQQIEETGFDPRFHHHPAHGEHWPQPFRLSRYGSLEEMIKRQTDFYMAKKEERNQVRLWETAVAVN